ncbi:hypothetical protein CASFOL_008421 [Castilleja foliolosa]|uniref:Pectinesterase inhibitor domain-containing protein n=1 Tax=Castilleja foliolosa TaxID=1961234 RepID=A0ABD3DYY1_9LAMI
MENQTIATTTLIVLTLVIYSGGAAAAGDTNTQFIRTSCSATAYPTLCYSSLSSHATAIQQNPKILAHTALIVTLNTARSTSADMVRISRRAGLSALETGAMRDLLGFI